MLESLQLLHYIASKKHCGQVVAYFFGDIGVEVVRFLFFFTFLVFPKLFFDLFE